MFGRLWKIITVQQDSLPGLFNWKDAVHTLRMAAIGATSLAAIAFLRDVDAFNFGIVDKFVTGLVLSAIVAIEAWKTNNS